MTTTGPNKQWIILEILQWTVDYFKQYEVDNPRLTAEILLAHVLQQDRMYLYVHFDQPLEQDEREQFKTLIRQRIQGVPTQYLTGKQEFWSLEFQVAPGVLIPRPETEHLVETAIQLAAEFSEPSIVDIGTGSGAIAISLKHELPHAKIYAGDISNTTLKIAIANGNSLLDSSNSVSFFQGDLFEPFSGMTFDLIVSNPPYISAEEYNTLAPEIREHEPKQALDAGEKGLDVYQRLIAEASSFLHPAGYVLVEIGHDQKEDVIGIFKDHNFTIKDVIQDYAGIERVIIAQQNSYRRV
jgi:release factor glutamine methyltransferase